MDSQRRKVLISDTRTPKPHESEDFSDAYSNFRSAAQKKRTFPTPYSRPHEEQSSSSSIEYVEPGSAKCSKLNIYDPLIQTTPIRRPEQLAYKKKNTHDSLMCECNGECLSKLINSTSEILLLKFQEVLQTERLMMMEMINKDSNNDALLLQLVHKAEEMNRENAILKLENKGFKDILGSLKK